MGRLLHIITVFITSIFIISNLLGCDAADPVTPKNETGALPAVPGSGGFRSPTETQLGALKISETAPGAPQALTAGIPTVKAVEYYKDSQLTKPLTGVVRPGTTFFIKVVFSEPMQHIVADDNTARPILYYRLDSELTRFRIAEHGAKGDDFVSGDGKPLHSGTDDYICKYTVPGAASGMFTVAIGKLNADQEGNTLSAFYTHKEKLQFGTAPSVEEVGYYQDWQLKNPITDSVQIGDTIFTKIVFSKGMQLAVSDDNDARPELYYRIGEQMVRHNIVPLGATGKHFIPGDTKPVKTQAVYLGKYTIQPDDRGLFTLVVGKNTTDKEGNEIAEAYTHEHSLTIEEPIPPLVKLDDTPSGTDSTNALLVTVTGTDVTHYKYSISIGETCGRFGFESSIRRPIRADLSGFSEGTITLCVIGKNRAGVWQTEPTTAQWTRDVPMMPEVPMTPEPQGTVVPQEPHEPAITLDPTLPDFTGFVFTPDNPTLDDALRSKAAPVTNVTVTIASGPRYGERTVTNQQGRYMFPNVATSELHLLVEKQGFEPKEVIVYRNRPTSLPNSITPNFPEDPQRNPGTVLIGHRWPDEVRPILRETRMVVDLLYVEGDPKEAQAGFYGSGIVYARSPLGVFNIFAILAHELAHAHQHAVVSIDGSGDVYAWDVTPEGRAYVEARAKDWQQGKRMPYDDHSYFQSNLLESAAETCAEYWTFRRWGKSGWPFFDLDLETASPNRFRWIQEWVIK